jgi:LysR family transcriptional regulator, nitrogen assimilation regulatory protein
MNLRQLKYFVKVVEFGNMTRAAEALHVAQPALGLQIRLLEELLSIELLERHSRGVSPTEAGDLLYRRATEILETVADVVQEMRAVAHKQRESVAFGLSPGLMRLLGPATMVRAKGELSRLSFTLVEGLSFDLLDMLEQRQVDIALAYDVDERPGLMREPLLEEELLFVTARDDRDVAPTISFAEVTQRGLVLAGKKDAIQKLTLATAKRLSLTCDIAYEATSVSAMRELVRQGAAASILPYGTLLREKDDTLRTQRIVAPQLKRTLYLVRSARLARRPAADLERFVDRMVSDLLDMLGELAAPLGARRTSSGAAIVQTRERRPRLT